MKRSLIVQITKYIDHYLEEKTTKVIRSLKDQLGGKLLKFAALRLKTYGSITGDNDGTKIAKNTKKSQKKRKTRFEDYKICSEINQLEKKKN